MKGGEKVENREEVEEREREREEKDIRERERERGGGGGGGEEGVREKILIIKKDTTLLQ